MASRNGQVHPPDVKQEGGDGDVKQECHFELDAHTAGDVNQDRQDKQDYQDRQDESGKTTTNNGVTTLRDPLLVGVDSHSAKWAAAQIEEAFANGVDSSLSIENHVLGCYAKHVEDHHELDAGGYVHNWRSDLWVFVRALKAHPELRNLSAKEALREVEKVISTWGLPGGTPDAPRSGYRKRAALRWERLFVVDPEDARPEFVVTWAKVRCLPGWEPLEYAIQRAEETPIGFGDDDDSDLLSVDTPGYRRFLSIAGWLQVTVGNRNIVLPVEKLARILKVKPMSISRYRAFAVEDGFLRPMRKHNWHMGRASEFRFDVKRVPMLAESAHRRVREGDADTAKLPEQASQRVEDPTQTIAGGSHENEPAEQPDPVDDLTPEQRREHIAEIRRKLGVSQ